MIEALCGTPVVLEGCWGAWLTLLLEVVQASPSSANARAENGVDVQSLPNTTSSSARRPKRPSAGQTQPYRTPTPN